VDLKNAGTFLKNGRPRACYNGGMACDLGTNLRVVKVGVSTRRCPYCHDSLSERELWDCPGCEASHHDECSRIHGGCAVYGCRDSSRRVVPFYSDSLLDQDEGWTWKQRVLYGLWFLFVAGLMLGFTAFIQWLLETPTEFSVAELVIISVF
jgi:hypothetical protein